MVGDTAQLGNARADIPIAYPGWWKRVAAVTAHLEQTPPKSKIEVATESIQSRSIISKRSVRSEE